MQSIEHDKAGVKVKYKWMGEPQEMSADYLVNCIPPPALRKIVVTPAFPPEKQFVIDNVQYDSYQRFVFQASSKFWEKDKISINIDFDNPDLGSVWQSADEVDTHRVIILGTGPGGVSPQRALAAFKENYPGATKPTIEQVVSKDWTKDAFAPTCERVNFPIVSYINFGTRDHETAWQDPFCRCVCGQPELGYGSVHPFCIPCGR